MRSALLGLVALLGLFGCGVEQGRIVVMGDSFAAAPGLESIDGGRCARSMDAGFPGQLRRIADVSPSQLVNVSCSGSKIDHLTHARDDGVPPQIMALNGNETAVVIMIGGNDTNFAELIESCALPAISPAREGCVSENGGAGLPDWVDAAERTIDGRLASALRLIRERSPNSTIVFANYPRILRSETQLCEPWHRVIDEDEAASLRAAHEQLNRVLRDEVERADVGARFVDIYEASDVEGICAKPDSRWVNAVSLDELGSFKWPFHPTKNGGRRMAIEIDRAINRDAVPDLVWVLTTPALVGLCIWLFVSNYGRSERYRRAQQVRVKRR